MELHELEIAHLRAAPVRHREAVAGRDGGVRRLAEHASGAARREQHGARARHARRDRRRTRSARPGTRRPPMSSVVASASCSTRTPAAAADPAPQRAGNLAARDVARVQHAPDAVRAFARERGLAIRVPIERHAPLDQLAHVARAFVDEQIDGRRDRTAPRRRQACRPGAVRVSRRDRWQRRCRPARTRCCSRRDRPSSAAGCRRGRSGWRGRGDQRCRPRPR